MKEPKSDKRCCSSGGSVQRPYFVTASEEYNQKEAAYARVTLSFCVVLVHNESEQCLEMLKCAEMAHNAHGRIWKAEIEAAIRRGTMFIFNTVSLLQR